MENFDSRTKALLGEKAIERLRGARVALFGLGGVGGYALEGLARSGVGYLFLADGDRFSESNLNRQILALHNTVGRKKTEVAAERARMINPAAKIELFSDFFLPERAGEIDFSRFDYVLDAIDMVTGKIALALSAKEANVPLISCMGTGNKLDPSLLRVRDLAETSVCPLARVMRRELKKRGITHLKTVCSEEVPHAAAPLEAEGKRPPASAVFVPAAAGMLMAAEVVRDLTKDPTV